MTFVNCPGCGSSMVNGVCSMCGFAALPNTVVGNEQARNLDANRTDCPPAQSKTELPNETSSRREHFSGNLSLMVRVAVYIVLGILAVPAGRLIGAGITYNLNAERREREAESEKELAEFRAQQKVAYDAAVKQQKEQVAKLDQHLANLRERYDKAVENADAQAAREVMIELREFDRILGLGLFKHEEVEAQHAEIVARYQAKLDQLYAEYETAIKAGDQATADRALSEAAALVRMSRNIK